MAGQTETIRVYDPLQREWRAMTVAATSAPVRRSQPVRPKQRIGAPVNRAGLSAGSPLPYLADTAFAPGEPLADMRTWVKEPTMATHRAATVMPAGNPGDPGNLARWTDL